MPQEVSWGADWVTVGNPCISHSAHHSLDVLVEHSQKWQEAWNRSKTKRLGRRGPITEHLLYLCRLEPDCDRFFPMAANILANIPSEVGLVHTNYWDTLGLVTGRAVEAGGGHHSSSILHRCLVGFFGTNDWVKRSLILRAFRLIGPKCVLSDPGVVNNLNSYQVRCGTTTSILSKSLPKAMGDTIEWLFEVWKLVAKECRRERQRLLQGVQTTPGRSASVERVVCSILREAFSLFMIYIKALDLNSSNSENCWMHWRDMLFEYTVPQGTWPDEEVRLVATPRIGSELQGLVGPMRSFVDQLEDPARKQGIEPEVLKLESALNGYWGSQENGP